MNQVEAPGGKWVIDELIDRRRLIRSFEAFVRHCGFTPAPHHQLLIAKLEELSKGKCKNLMVFMPPGSAKTTYASVLFPAWYLAQAQAGDVIVSSYSVARSIQISRKVRKLVEEYGYKLCYSLSKQSRSVEHWETSYNRFFRAVGVGSSVTGFRSSLNLIDDPVKGREEAESERARDKAWDWYNDDLNTRLVPGGRQVLIMTRWHEDDLAGRLLNREGELWEVISLPAEAVENDPLGRAQGEFLWDDGYGYADRLRALKTHCDARSWSALFQQQPAPKQGALFKAEWFHRGTLPYLSSMQLFGASDYAVSSGRGDYTCHILAGLSKEGKLWIVDVWRKQADASESTKQFVDWIQRHKPNVWAQESGQIKNALEPFLNTQMRERRLWVKQELFPSKAEKSVRAQSILAHAAHEGIWIPIGAPWAQALIAECLSFPAGKHDDQVDALGLIGMLIDKVFKRNKESMLSNHPVDWRIA